MSDQEQELLEGIWAEPDRDDVRLVYADWLQQQGDPRGEFIMLQMERESRPLSLAESAREFRLLRDHSEAWLGRPRADPRAHPPSPLPL